MANIENVATTIRGLTVKEWAAFIREELELTIKRADRTCMRCEHLDQASQVCRKAGRMPPPTIAVNGCELWSEEIPF